MRRPRLFIGSSTEGLQIAKSLQMNLDHAAEVTVWTNNIFEVSQTQSESLFGALDASDFAAFVFTPDDVVESRNQTYNAPRDNVIFELGLFAGRLGLHRTYIVKPRDATIKIPTDLFGINTVDYENHTSGNVSAMVQAASTKIEYALDRFSNSRDTQTMEWADFCGLIAELGDKLKRSPHARGFMPDIILGLSRGGIIVADLLSRYLGGRIPSLCLWADRHKEHQSTVIAPPKNDINSIIKTLLGKRRYKNVLLVDDISRRGQTICRAKDFIESVPSELVVKTLLVVVHENASYKPDYIGMSTSDFDLRLPFSILG
ncbi:hypothetical protein HED60_05490 [Planctomycetales bacterium ZRK34]|nr:hypothetical protein HED60_05490 [Planctomycetales bacterium ZRK34]